uniref:Uncharacterized protein n=1 Tax=Pelagomonas calceolata TaxID=35677 RepID=A0A7S4E2J4_9STRA|mmetsp:Transcript_10900/g.33689  ORF Transcript_10900/g.33689 Transcript_10900/m.33689 type:complete len:183 (-) Transcript_10900:28-576(-)
MCLVVSTVDSPCALLVDIAALVRGSAETAARWPRTPAERDTHGLHASDAPAELERDAELETDALHALEASAQRPHFSRRAGGGGPPGGFGGGFGGNVFPTPGEETGFFFMLPKKKNSATQNEKTTLKTKKNRKAEKHLKLGLPALKLAIAQNPIKGFFKAFFDFSPAEGSVTYAENTVSTRK